MKLFVLSWSPCSHRPCSPLTHSAPRYRMSLSVSYTRQIPTPQALPSLLSPLTRQTQPIQTHIWDTIYNLRVYGLCFLQFYCHRETFSSASTSAIKTTCLHTQLLGLPFFNTCTHTHARTHPTPHNLFMEVNQCPCLFQSVIKQGMFSSVRVKYFS